MSFLFQNVLAQLGVRNLLILVVICTTRHAGEETMIIWLHHQNSHFFEKSGHGSGTLLGSRNLVFHFCKTEGERFIWANTSKTH